MEKGLRLNAIRKALAMTTFGSFPVGYDEGAIANILSLMAVTDKYRITYDSENGGMFCVHTRHGIVELHPHPNVLHHATIDAIKEVSMVHHHT